MLYAFILDSFDSHITDSWLVETFIDSHIALILQSIFFSLEITNLALYLPLVFVAYPANTLFFFDVLLRIAAKDLVDIDGLNEAVWNDSLQSEAGDEDMRVQNFEKLGLDGANFFPNVASTFTVFAVQTLVLAFGCILLHRLKCKRCKRIYKLRAECKAKIFWNLPLEFMDSAYSVLAICALLNLHMRSWQTPELFANSFCALLFFVLVAIYPILLQQFLYENDEKLKQRDFRLRFGSGYSDFELKNERYYAYPYLLLYRRLTVPACFILYPERFLLQFIWLQLTSSAMILLVASRRPFKSGKQNTNVIL